MKNRVVQFAIANAVVVASASIANAEAFDNCVKEYLDTGMRVEMAEKWCDADSNVHLSKFMNSDLDAKASALAPYKFTNLNALTTNPLPTTAYPYGSNSYDTMVGVVNEPGVTAQGFIKSQEPASFVKFQVVIGTGLPTTAVAINDKSTVVGHYKPPTGSDRGFIKLNGSSATENFIHPEATYARGGLTRAKDINNIDEVVGYSARTDTGVLYSWKKVGTVFTTIKNGAFDTIVEGNNDAGLVIGHYTSGSQSIGFVLHNGTFVTIQPPGSAGGSVRPLDINNHNQIVGSFTNTAGISISFLAEYNPSKKTFKYITVDGTATVPTTMTLNGINDAGMAIGQSSSPTSRSIFGPTCGFPNLNWPTLAMPRLSPLMDSKNEEITDKYFDIRSDLSQLNISSNKDVRENFRKTLISGREDEISIDLDFRGTPSNIFSKLGFSMPSTERPFQIAKRFLKSNSQNFRTSAASIDEVKEEFSTLTNIGSNSVVTIRQKALGLPIFQSSITFNINPNGVIESMAGSVAPEHVAGSAPTISSEEALKRTISYISGNRNPKIQIISKSEKIEKETLFNLSDYSETDANHGASLVYFPMAESLHLAWETVFHKSSVERYIVVVDASNGEILYASNMVKHAAPEGKIFPFNPTRSANKSVVRPFKLDWFDGATLAGNNTCVRENMDGAARIYDSSESPTVPPKILNRRAGYRPVKDNLLFNKNFSNSYVSSNGTDPTTDLDAAATNTFYWVNQMHDYFKSIGFDEANFNFQADNLGQPGKGSDEVHVLVHNNWLLPEDPINPIPPPINKRSRDSAFFYSPADGYQQKFGKPTLGLTLFRYSESEFRETVDPSFDSSLLIHEYAHGVSMRMVGKGGTGALEKLQSKALGEGWSDFLAGNYLADPVIGAYVSGDAVSGLRETPLDKGVRTYGNICGTNTLPVCHNKHLYEASIVWSSALWQARRYLIPPNATPAQITDISTKVANVVINGMKGMPTNPTMVQAKNATVTTANTLYGATFGTAFEKAFACKGLGTNAASNSADNIKPTEGFKYSAGECLPNLAVALPLGAVPGSIKRGSSFSLLNATVNNGEAPSKTTYTRFFLSTNGTTRSVTLVGSRTIGELHGFGGAQVAEATSLTVPATTAPRRYFVLTCPNICPAGEADCKIIKETDQANCVASSSQITVTQ